MPHDKPVSWQIKKIKIKSKETNEWLAKIWVLLRESGRKRKSSEKKNRRPQNVLKINNHFVEGTPKADAVNRFYTIVAVIVLIVLVMLILVVGCTAD